MKARTVSVIIPARNAGASIGGIVRASLAQRRPGVEVEVIVVDDASTDDTAAQARAAGARTLVVPASAAGNPAAARNLGARAARGEILVFLDADCVPVDGWLRSLLDAHDRGEVIVGGALDLPNGLPFSARCDYFCGWYHVHSRRPAGYVASHPPANISVRRDLFLSTSGFDERHPVAFAHEELRWQAELVRRGVRIYFEPAAVALHRNRPGFGNLLGRSYRWGYSAIESKAATGAARMAWLYGHPRVLIAFAPASAVLQALYIVASWLRVGVFEPCAMLPAVLAARVAYTVGMVVGGIRWLRSRHVPESIETRPRWA
ncbi:MAG TPA: glycosyltransferase [Longimicrobiales bacterium]